MSHERHALEGPVAAETPATVADAIRGFLRAREALREFRRLTRADRRSLDFYEREDAFVDALVDRHRALRDAIGLRRDWFPAGTSVVRIAYLFGQVDGRAQVVPAFTRIDTRERAR